jgi:hypothetical protein
MIVCRVTLELALVVVVVLVFIFIHVGYLCGGDSCGCGHHECLGSLGCTGGRFVVFALLALLDWTGS